jgi:hypothetical protein
MAVRGGEGIYCHLLHSSHLSSTRPIFSATLISVS